MNFPVRSIGIIGGGVVGRATARTYHGFADVRVFDVMPERSTTGDNLDLARVVATSDLVFVCLPETALDGFFAENHRFNWGVVNLVIRSTVPIGTTRRLREKHKLLQAVHSPEFLTARCAVADAMTPARNIVGFPEAIREGIDIYTNNACGNLLVEVYRERFPGVPAMSMTSDESEAVKLIVNGFFATKIVFFNEARSLADNLGLDWDRVLAGVLSDGRIAHSHTMVPGSDGKRGFGGACLPKDLKMLIEGFEGTGESPTLLMSAAIMNKKHRGEQP